MKLIHAALFLALPSQCASQTRVNADSALVQEFQNRLSGYMKLHKQVASGLALKPTNSSGAIAKRSADFAEQIRAARPSAHQGDIFTAPVSAEFRRLVGIAMEGRHAQRVRQSLSRAEPVKFQLAVNGAYPEGVPLQSTPPSLLLNLPKLPADVEYRLIGKSLALRDTKANLVIDFMPNALP